jgi:NitT/TauT family transport system substrate-binding protein
VKLDRVTSALAVLILSLAAVPAQAQDKVTVASATAVTAVPVLIAANKGFFQQEGLTVEVKRLAGGNETINALAANTVEFAESSHAQFISASAKGLPVAGISLVSRGFFGKMIAAPRNADLTDLKQYKGKRIGIQAGTGVYTVFMMTLEKQGLDPKDFTISNMRVNDMPAVMQSNDFDAVVAWEPQAKRIVESGRGKEVISAARFEEMADITYPFILLTHRRILNDRREMVQRYVNGMARAQKFIRENRKATIDFYRSTLPPDVRSTVPDAELEEQIYGASRYDRVEFAPGDLTDLRRTAEFLAAQKTIDRVPDLGTSIDLEIGRRAQPLVVR